MDRYWTWWVLIAFPITFLIPETIALLRGRPQDTLSEWVWRHAQVIAHQPLKDWSASHVLFAGTFIVLAVWLTAHFTLRIWT